jgi:uncharacterized protein YjbI with pentapeptide repeats
MLAVMAYLTIAVAGVTHKDLLLETPVALPILQVPIQLAQFFQFAPILLVLLHLGIISQLVLLAKETLEFDHSIRLLEPTERRTHPLRLELNNFFFVQAIAGPHRSAVMGFFLHGMSWLTLVLLPVVLLLYIQVVFLPYHDETITWTHRVALVVDIIMLISIGLFLMRVETSFVQAFMRTTSSHPVSFVSTILVLMVVSLFSFFFATIPGEMLDRWTQTFLGIQSDDEGTPGPRFASGFTVPFLTAKADGSLLGIFLRNLVVTDADLVIDRDVTPGEPSLSLRGRDLRFAKLDRTDLHQADLTGSDLRAASLVGADLRGVYLQCADITELLLNEDRTAARCTVARRANFTRARLEEAHLAGIDLRSAKLEEAKLDGAELTYALLTGANFASARLEKVDMTGGVQAQGANFLIAGLQGADLSGAKLQLADFSYASLQGAVLNHAHLEAAILRDADLEAAALNHVRLEGADMTGAKIAGADLRGAGIWMTKPPEADASGMADLTEIAIRPLGEDDIAGLKAMLEHMESRRVRPLVAEALAPLFDPETSGKWSGSPEQSRWASLITTPLMQGDYRARVTDYLSRLMCKARWSNGSVATGIVRRAQAQQFRGDLVAIYDRLKADDCPAAKTVPAKVLRDFALAADLARGN